MSLYSLEYGDKVIHQTAYGDTRQCTFIEYLQYSQVLVKYDGADMVCSEKDVYPDIEFKLDKLGL